MEYKLYTLVDITHTGQHRSEPGKEADRWREQNFNTVIHTLGIRSNIVWVYKPAVLEIAGRLVGFNTDNILRVWRFDWATDRDFDYQVDTNPVGTLEEDFNLVPYISGLDEQMTQKYAVFTTQDPGRNIAFFKK
jgi:hypothetical protein